MILTGRALEDFTKWNGDRQFDMMLPFEYPIYLNALIIEWFDSIGIYISINYVSFYDELRNDKGFEAYVTNNGLSVKFRSLKNRKAAAKQAIIKANDIYNETNA